MLRFCICHFDTNRLYHIYNHIHKYDKNRRKLFLFSLPVLSIFVTIDLQLTESCNKHKLYGKNILHTKKKLHRHLFVHSYMTVIRCYRLLSHVRETRLIIIRTSYSNTSNLCMNT